MTTPPVGGVRRVPVRHFVTPSDSIAPKLGVPTLRPPESVDLERLRSGLQIIALRALGDPDAAEEAVQETLARAVIALDEGRLDDPAKLGAYVAGIARHVCSHIRRDRKPTLSLEGADGSAAQLNEPELVVHSNALETLISAAEEQRLRAAFGTLPPGDQRLLRLCFHEDRTPAEIADALGEPPERVRKRKSRALDRLRRAFLGAAGHDDESDGTGKVAPMPTTDGRGTDHD